MPYLGKVLVHLHAPDADGGGPSVVIVPPFGWEDVSSHRARRAWADRIGAGGACALRLDLPGTGDSGGGPLDPGLVAAWIDAVGRAAAHLRDLRPDQRVVAIGLGMGGLLAWAAAADGAAIDDLVLWGVPARGRALVRELKAFAALKNDEWGDGPPPADAPVLEGAFDVTGYVVADATAADLSGLDLSRLDLPDASERRILLLGRDGLPVDRRLEEHALALGCDVETDDGPGWGAMVAGPQETVAPTGVFERVDAWLAGAPAAPLGAAPDPPPMLDVLALDRAEERPWTVQRDFGTQFGILARPVGGGPAPLGLLLLNAGAVRHTGPNRMWVEAARRWAPRDVPVLRLDIEGLGDSDGDGRPYVDSAVLYEPILARQAQEAVRDLVAGDVAERWLVVGLCAGGAWAFHAVLSGGAHIPAALLVNPFAFYWDDELVTERDVDAASRLRSADGWKRVLSGQVSRERIRGVAVRALKTPFERGRRREHTEGRVGREHADLDRIAADGKRLAFLIGRDEPIYARFEREGTIAALPRWPNVELRRLPTRDHTFRAPWLQARVHAELDRFVEAERRA